MKKSAVKWLFKVTGKQNIKTALLTLVQAVFGASGVVFVLFMRNAVDSAVNSDREGFVYYAVLMVMLIILQLVLRACVRLLEESCRSSVENALKKRLWDCLLKKDYAEVTAIHSGEWINRLTSDTAVAANGITEIIPNAVGMAVKMLSALIMILVIEPKFAVVIIPGGIILIALSHAFRKILKRLHKNVQESDGRLRVFLQERLSNLMMVRSFAAEEETENQAAEKMSAHKAARMKKNCFSNFCNTGFGAAMNGLYIFGFIYAGCGILNGSLSYGTLTAILQLVGQIQAPFANISGYLPKFYAMTASAERLAEAESYRDDCPNGAKSCEEIQSFYKDSLKEISFENITFAYPDSENLTVLENVSLSISKGDYAAFTGISGCGKSTLLKLLMSFYKLKGGEISLITSNGKMPLSSEWHRLFAYVPQGNQLMNGSIRETVSFARPDEINDNDKINAALKISCADEFISELENGIDTVLGERGAGLSEGQTQRIAIARAVFSDCPVLLLDEATSALDDETEQRLLLNLKEMTDKTVLIVTHRPAALEICGRIFETDNKTVTEVLK